MLHISCNIGTRDLPDMYALSPQTCNPQALGIHIRQITHAYVTIITYLIVIQWAQVVCLIYTPKARGPQG